MKIYKEYEDYSTKEFIMIISFLMFFISIWILFILIIGGNILCCI